jgi:surface protein
MRDKIIAEDREHLKSLIKEEMKLNGHECDLNHIDVSQVNNMAYLFSCSKFNGDISQWDTSKVTNMNNMFTDSMFNGDISNWNTSKVKHMSYMFEKSKFNGDISKWKVSKVKEMSWMFLESEFTQDLSIWKPLQLITDYGIFAACNAPIPYWAEIDNPEERKETIKNHILKEKLNTELSKELINNGKAHKRAKI